MKRKVKDSKGQRGKCFSSEGQMSYSLLQKRNLCGTSSIPMCYTQGLVVKKNVEEKKKNFEAKDIIV